MTESSAKNRPSELELQILGILWEHGPATIRQILDLLADEKERGYTTVLSVVQSMQRKKLVSARRMRNKRAYLYAARTSRESILGPMLKRLVRNVFGGDPAAAVQQLLASSDLDPETIARMRMIVAESEASSTDGRKPQDDESGAKQ